MSLHVLEAYSLEFLDSESAYLKGPSRQPQLSLGLEVPAGMGRGLGSLHPYRAFLGSCGSQDGFAYL